MALKLKTSLFGRPWALRFAGSVLLRVSIPCLVLGLWALCCCLLNMWFVFQIPVVIFQTGGWLVVSLLLAFRTNTAYERFWEGRKLFSTLTTNTRCIRRMVEDEYLHCVLVSYCHSVVNQARGRYGCLNDDGLLRLEYSKLIITHEPQFQKNYPYFPMYLLQVMNDIVTAKFKENLMDAPTLSNILAILNSMTDMLASIERIIHTYFLTN